MSPLRTILVIFSVINIVNCLPVTSKPIEKRPEDWQWDTSQLGPKQTKMRKSIFVVPNITSFHVECPPGSRIDNFKCLPTFDIDHTDILEKQFQNIFNNSSYDYDYDDEGGGLEDPPKPDVESTNTTPDDYTPGPIRISLNEPPQNSNSKGVEFGIASEVDLNQQNFHGESSSSTATSTSTTTNTSESESSISEQSATTATATSPTVFPGQSISSTIESSSILPTTSATTDTPLTADTVAANNTDDKYGLIEDNAKEVTDTDGELEIGTGTAVVQTKLKDGLFNESHLEPSYFQPRPEKAQEPTEFGTDMEVGETKLKDGLFNESYLIPTIHQPTPMKTKEPTEFETNIEVVQTKLKDGLFNESHLVSSSRQQKPVELNESTESTEEPTTTSIQEQFRTSSTSINIADRTTAETANPPLREDNNNSYTGEGVGATTFEIQDDQEPIMESIESNNRFVYHHLGPAKINHSQKRGEVTAPDVQEPPAITNKQINEPAEQSSIIRFPTDPTIQADNWRNDFILFPGPTSSRQLVPTAPARFLDNKKVIPISHQSAAVFTPSTTTTTTTIATPTARKPFLWIPSQWEIDRDGDEPLLLRFWSRAAPTTSSSTTTGFRENSRRPTDNLFREFFTPNVFRVFDARNQHENT